MMRTTSLVLLLAGAIPTSLFSQDQSDGSLTPPLSEQPSGEPVLEQAAPPPRLAVAPEDILETKTVDIGEREVIVQKIAPLELPDVPEIAVVPLELSPEEAAKLEEHKQVLRETTFVSLGATVYRAASLNGEIRTMLQVRDRKTGRDFKCWSSADWSLFSGGEGSLEIDGHRYVLMMGHSTIDIDKWTQFSAARGQQFVAPVFPEMPPGSASFVVAEGDPTPESLASLNALHSHYNSHLAQLKAEFQAREIARQQDEENRRNNPPQPKNIVIRHWRLDEAGQQGITPKPAVAR